VVPCNIVVGYERFRGPCCLHLYPEDGGSMTLQPDMKDSFCKGLERVLDQFPKNHVEILLRDFNAKVGREDIFKQTIGKEPLHEINNDNGLNIVKFSSLNI
jgi:hypothetical protein